MNEFLEQFIIEGRELLEQGSRDLLRLEEAPTDREPLDGAFRAIHTLKGAAGIVEFVAMGRALHVVEDTLAGVRAGKLPVTPQLVTNCLASFDQVSAWLRQTETLGDLPADAEAEADRIVALFAASAPEPPVAPLESGRIQRARALLHAQMLLIADEGQATQGRLSSAAQVAKNVLQHLGDARGADRLAALGDDIRAQALSSALQSALNNLGAVDPAAAAPAARTDGAALSLRVDVARVDALVKLTGELTTVKNAIGHVSDLASEGGDPVLVATMLRDQHAALDRLVVELQASILNVRVLPMRQVFQRFPRLVREISADLDRPTRLITEGQDTEADKAIVEALFEPLLHVVRNSLDHGIEDASLRSRRGKPAIAKVVLRALRAGEHVVIEVEDDGGGIDIPRVRSLAVERGVASADAVAAMSDAEAADLIFTAGFSTAKAVSAISGRGVGMDAVRSAIEGMGGSVGVETWAEKGAIVRFQLPFTLMVTRVMVVSAGGQVFGIPFDAVAETVRVPRKDVSSVGAAKAFVYRDRTVPVVSLASSLGGPASETGDDAVLVVAHVAGALAAFDVDQVGSGLDVMLSPLDGLLAGVPGIAGVTVLGDGKVLIVLDLPGLLG